MAPVKVSTVGLTVGLGMSLGPSEDPPLLHAAAADTNVTSTNRLSMRCPSALATEIVKSPQRSTCERTMTAARSRQTDDSLCPTFSFFVFRYRRVESDAGISI